MKKIILFLAIIAVALVSCQDKGAFTIEGSFSEDQFEGKTVYLQKIDSMTAEVPTVIDSVVIKDKKFSFKGSTEEDKSLAFVSVGKLGLLETNSPVGTIILEPGKIEILFKENGDVNISGTPGNDEYNKVLSVMNEVAAFYKEVSEAGGIQGVPLDSAGNDVETRMGMMQDNMRKATFDFAKANMTNKAGQFIFFTSANTFSREQLSELVEASDSIFKKKPEIVTLIEELSRVIPEVGQPYVDFQMVDANGATVSLSQFVGKSKCVLVDFWASWCAPCIEEMPALRNMYAKYKGKGLEIVGVSVDEDKTAWLGAVEKHNMNWVQLADDKRHGIEFYAVMAIPHTILINEEGVIVAKNLIGKELESKIAEILK